MNAQSARNAKEFVHILAKDNQSRPTRFHVPGHARRHYEVSLERNDHLGAYCFREDDDSGDACRGNSHAVCYHVLAACLIAAEAQGKELSWCESETDAERLARVGGKVFTVKSAQSGMSAWGVVREIEPEPKLAAVGLSKNKLIKLAIEKASDKKQWHSSELLWLAEDAFLANDGGFVRLYRTYPDPKYPKYPQSKSLAIVFWLDPKEGCWKRYTAGRAMEELFDDHDSAIPVQHSRGRSKLFKE